MVSNSTQVYVSTYRFSIQSFAWDHTTPLIRGPLASMLVPSGLGCCLSLLYLCILFHRITCTPFTASPTLQLPQSPLPTDPAALGQDPTLVFNESYGTTLPSNATNLTTGDWPNPPFSAFIPGFGSECKLQFFKTGREGAFLERVVLLDIINNKVVQWRREQGTYMPADSSPFGVL